MIIRQWRGRADHAREQAYPAHFREHVAGELWAVHGFLGADLLRRTDADGSVEFTVLTRWASMDAIHAFAGDDPTCAVVEPGAQAALTSYDRTVTHHTVVDHPARPRGSAAPLRFRSTCHDTRCRLVETL